jgi:hypothetical protein
VNASAVAKHYDRLTAEERFRLIVAAGARGDAAEQERLRAAGQRITLSMSDHAPFAHAFDELDLLVFIELLEAAADYFDAFHWADDAEVISEHESNDEPEDDEAEPDVDAGEAEPEGEDRPTAGRRLNMALAKGFILKTKGDGWKLFCEWMNVPPFAAWEGLPGFDRVQRALQLAERAAFVPDGMVRWLNSVRPDGKPEATVEGLISAEKLADALEELFRQRVAWWGG